MNFLCHYLRFAFVCFFFLVFGVFTGSLWADHEASPLKVRDVGVSGTLFERIHSDQTGLDLDLKFPSGAPFDLLTDQTSGTGVAVGDVDGDGLPDIYFTAYDRGNRLYRNLGGWRFEDITMASQVTGEGRWCGGTSFVDVDNDGDLDLFVCVYGDSNLLYLNRGDGVFDERAKEFGLDFRGASVMMAFADYDRDGDLDAYLVTHRFKQRPQHLLPKSTREAVDRGILEIDTKARRAIVRPAYREYFELMDKGAGRVELIIAGQRDRLYRNDGEDGFVAVSDEAGIRGFGIGLAVAWWDYNNDGWPDIYVSNDYKGADRLYRNNKNGSFTEVARQSLPHVPWFSMGSDSADLNNDGYLDFLASDMSGRDHFSQKMGMGEMGKNRWFLMRSNPQQYMRNALFLGTGTERVLESAYLAGLANTDWTWSPKFGDFDLDGRVDLFVSNGMSRDFMNSDLSASIRSRDDVKWRETPVLKQPNLAYRNLGELSFESVGKEWGLDQVAASYGVAVSDLDRDGDLDLVVASFDEPVSAFRNRGVDGRGLLMRLVGAQSNRWGIGCKVSAEIDGMSVTRVLTSSQGFMSSNEPLIHMGFEELASIGKLRIEWPSGVIQELAEVQTGMFLTVQEPASLISPKEESSSTSGWFAKKPTGFKWQHRERVFDDYKDQPLLPSRQSQSGPGIAVGDVDNDGDDDLFLGGAAGQSGTLLVREGSDWRQVKDPFSLDAKSEDMGVLFFDADGDDDLDLYVVSGGVEARVGSPLLRDRLYLNRGKVRFKKASEGELPSYGVSGSVVTACDFDRDGDLDLFVGGRTVPGQYPMAAPNQLLLNDQGRFSDVTLKVAPGLRESGIVISALWSDKDGDGWMDLLLTHHWGTVAVFQNQNGQLVDDTEASGLSREFGWWNGIAGADFDRDGDIDYVVSNLGRNTKYHGDHVHPSVIYYGDVDGSGVSRIVEAKFEGEICYPERGKSCSTAAIPSLAGKFKSFEGFALASLGDIYPSQRLDQTLRLEVNRLESVLLRNNSGQFSVEPLPVLAQVAPGAGLVAADFDSDGSMDVFIAQNDFSPQPETGRMDGGMALLLKGGADQSLEALWPRTSGVSVPGDGKSVVVVDLNKDSRPDILVAQNNGPVSLFVNQGPKVQQKPLALRLIGPAGNPNAIGARVKVSHGNSLPMVQEVYGGSGYLGQSTSVMFFGLPVEAKSVEVVIRWPDGVESKIQLTDQREGVVSVRYPD